MANALTEYAYGENLPGLSGVGGRENFDASVLGSGLSSKGIIDPSGANIYPEGGSGYFDDTLRNAYVLQKSQRGGKLDKYEQARLDGIKSGKLDPIGQVEDYIEMGRLPGNAFDEILGAGSLGEVNSLLADFESDAWKTELVDVREREVEAKTQKPPRRGLLGKIPVVGPLLEGDLLGAGLQAASIATTGNPETSNISNALSIGSSFTGGGGGYTPEFTGNALTNADINQLPARLPPGLAWGGLGDIGWGIGGYDNPSGHYPPPPDTPAEIGDVDINVNRGPDDDVPIFLPVPVGDGDDGGANDTPEDPTGTIIIDPGGGGGEDPEGDPLTMEDILGFLQFNSGGGGGSSGLQSGQFQLEQPDIGANNNYSGPPSRRQQQAPPQQPPRNALTQSSYGLPPGQAAPHALYRVPVRRGRV